LHRAGQIDALDVIGRQTGRISTGLGNGTCTAPSIGTAVKLTNRTDEFDKSRSGHPNLDRVSRFVALTDLQPASLVISVMTARRSVPI